MKNQQGMSVVGFLMVASLVGFLALTAVKLVPVYIEFNSVKQAMDAAVSQSSGARDASASEIRESLSKRLSMNYVSSVKPSDIKITPQSGGGFKLSVDYEAEKPLMGNVHFLVKFNHEASTMRESE